LGGAVSAGAGVGGTHEKNRTEMKVDFGGKEIRVITPPGDVKITSASMLVPRSHFVQVLKKMGGSEKEPDQATLDKFIAGEVVKLKAGVKTALALASDDAVYVDSFTDLLPLAMGIPQAAGTSMTLLATDHMKEITLGVLALASLLMVSMMVKKSVPRVTAAAASPLKASPQLDANEEMVGEVSENNPVLEGMELDEESVRSQQVISQVSNLVGENPEAAATMVKRWMNRS
jgi:flagellar biosynthesis/type III secretory pathway M-ring protein FliF/YscJ